jgi:hypothetical protein
MMVTVSGNDEARRAVLAKTRAQLRQADIALRDVMQDADPERRMAGIWNVVVWARSVTPVLQQLRSVADGFDAWYVPWRDEMASDPLLRYFYQLRNDVLKAGAQAAGISTHVHSFSSKDIPPAPPGAIGFFMGDELGGNGWDIQLPDGARTKIYVSIPESQAQTTVTLSGMPSEHLGQPVENSARTGCSLYFAYIQRLVVEASVGSARRCATRRRHARRRRGGRLGRDAHRFRSSS